MVVLRPWGWTVAAGRSRGPAAADALPSMLVTKRRNACGPDPKDLLRKYT
jgi:hypothetical protein